MKKKILAFTIVSILGVSSLAFNSFAEDVNNQVGQERQMGERPERPENEIFGKITAISENSVTISLAEMKKPEDGQGKIDKNFDGQGRKDEQNRNNDSNKNQNQPPEKKELTEEQKAEMKKKMEEMFTLTGETKTIDISKADFNAFGRGPKDGKTKGADANANNNTNSNQKPVKTYKDYQVGDYISIELESKDSNTAKTVKDAFMMRGGMRPRDNKQGNSGNNTTTTN